MKIRSIQQQRVLDFVKSFRAEHDMSPSTREIAEHLGVQLSTTQAHIEHLIRDGHLHRATVPGNPHQSVPRGLRPGRAVGKAKTVTF